MEDIHLNLEKMLIDEIGPVGGKFHTARSRNDQVATDMHLYMSNQTNVILELITAFQRVILGNPEQRGNNFSRIYTSATCTAYFLCASFNGLFLGA